MDKNRKLVGGNKMNNINNEEEYDLIEELKKAYKKLKCYAYYDNRNVYLKQRIVEFEAKNEYELDSAFISLKDSIITNKLNKYLVGDCFKVRTLPKSIDYNNEKNLITNYKNNINAKIDRIIHFIDLSIEAQIIGVLWVMYVGKELENNYYKYNAGNRLDSKALDKGLKLFRPYYLEYQRWRNDAIDIVENRIDEGKRSIMISLDIKEYFYSVNIKKDEKTKKHINKIIDKCENDEQKIVIKRINKFIFQVIDKYSESIIDKNDRGILPIGFLPSLILGNLYLNDLDKEIVKKINPLYYKRYVDDMLIVLNGDFLRESNYNTSRNIEKLLNELFCKNDIFKLAIMDKRNKIYTLDSKDDIKEFLTSIPRENIELKKNIIESIKLILESDLESEELLKKIKKNSREIVYKDWSKGSTINIINDVINKEKILNEFSNYNFKNINTNNLHYKKIFLVKRYVESNANICIQDEKIKIYDFKENASKAIIENFKNELIENASVFKFLPEKTEILKSFDSEVYKIDYTNDINKLSNIEKVDISKYNLTKFLARIIYSDKLENSTYTNDVDDKILWIFNGPISIEYYFLWGRVLNYYLLNEKYSHIKDNIYNYYRSIDRINVEINKRFILNSFKADDDEIKKNLNTDLKEYLNIIISMKYALNDEMFLEEINEFLQNEEILKNDKFKNIDEILEKKLINNIKKKFTDIDSNNVNFKGIFSLKEKFRQSNMLEHNLIRQPLMNYMYDMIRNRYSDNKHMLIINYLKETNKLNEAISDLSCNRINEYYKDTFKNICKYVNKCDECEKGCHESFNENKFFNSFAIEYSPRFVHLHECIIFAIYYLASKGKVIRSGEELSLGIKCFNKFNKVNYSDEKYIFNIVKRENNAKIIKSHLKYFNGLDYLFVQKESLINYIEVNSREQKNYLKIAIVNMNVKDKDLEDSFKKISNLDEKRLENLNRLLNQSVKNGAEMIIFPEVSIPIQWLGVLSNFSIKHDVAIIGGLEHIIYENRVCCNYLFTILPERNKEFNYSIIKLRLKNHYSPNEKEWVRGYGWKLPQRTVEDASKEYDLFRWKGIDFTSFNCFELANIKDRSLFISYVDLMIGSVHNRDLNYYSSIIESLSRDVHCYLAHVNCSRMGDNRIIKPASTNEKNILQITGGLNDTVLIGEINIKELREFQCKDHNLQLKDKRFKPVPPEFNNINVKIRYNLPL